MIATATTILIALLFLVPGSALATTNTDTNSTVDESCDDRECILDNEETMKELLRDEMCTSNDLVARNWCDYDGSDGSSN